MIRHIFKIIWNERKHNIGIWIELFLVSIFVWFIADFLFVNIRNYCKPAGFNVEHTYKMSVRQQNNQNYPYDASQSNLTKGEVLNQVLTRISQNPMIEAASLSLFSCPYTGSNSSQLLFYDTLQCYTDILLITPGFFRVFQFESINGSTDELVKALERNEFVISPEVRNVLFSNGQEAKGKEVTFEKNDSSTHYRIGAVSEAIRYHNFISNEKPYFAQNITYKLEEYADYADYIEICVRVKPHEDYDFITRFRSQMTEQLHIGTYYLSTIQSIPVMKKEIQLDDVNGLKMRLFIMLFLLVNIFLGITGIFWFRTQYRRNEIGIRIAMGSTPRKILYQFYAEGILLLVSAIIPTIVLYIWIKVTEIIHYAGPLTNVRLFIGCSITFVLLAFMIIGGIWFPAHKAVSVSPAEVLRDE